jgi:steroid 5-alpha reductase family enzyme
LSLALVLALLVELIADQQQWNFQRAKREYLSTGTAPPGYRPSDLTSGFVVTGLWSLCRHPNFVAEQTIWALVYLWGSLVTDCLRNWTAVGVVSYLALFQGSVTLTEWISARKYPEYREYQRMVSRFVPGTGAFTGEVKVWKKEE